MANTNMPDEDLPTLAEADYLLREMRSTINPRTRKPFDTVNSRASLDHIRAALAFRLGLPAVRLINGKKCFQKAAKSILPEEKINSNSGTLVKKWYMKIEMLEQAKEQSTLATDLEQNKMDADDLIEVLLSKDDLIDVLLSKPRPQSDPTPPCVPSLPPSAPSLPPSAPSAGSFVTALKPDSINAIFNAWSMLGCFLFLQVLVYFASLNFFPRQTLATHELISLVINCTADNEIIERQSFHYNSCMLLQCIPDPLWLLLAFCALNVPFILLITKNSHAPMPAVT